MCQVKESRFFVKRKEKSLSKSGKGEESNFQTTPRPHMTAMFHNSRRHESGADSAFFLTDPSESELCI